MHMCTYVSEDPKVVLALRITSREAYDKYKLLASLSKMGKVLPFTPGGIKDGVLFVPVDVDASWGWMEGDAFDEAYHPVESWSKTRFTMCEALNTKEKVRK